MSQVSFFVGLKRKSGEDHPRTFLRPGPCLFGLELFSFYLPAYLQEEAKVFFFLLRPTMSVRSFVREARLAKQLNCGLGGLHYRAPRWLQAEAMSTISVRCNFFETNRSRLACNAGWREYEKDLRVKWYIFVADFRFSLQLRGT